jgi:excisionase family DNA binding protein
VKRLIRSRTAANQTKEMPLPDAGTGGVRALQLGDLNPWQAALKRSREDPTARRLLRVREVAFVLGCGRDKVYSLIRRGEIRSVPIDRMIRVSVVALDEFIARLEAEAA